MWNSPPTADEKVILQRIAELEAEVERLRADHVESEEAREAFYDALAECAAAIGLEVWGCEEVPKAVAAEVERLEDTAWEAANQRASDRFWKSLIEGAGK